MSDDMLLGLGAMLLVGGMWALVGVAYGMGWRARGRAARATEARL